MTAGDPGCWCCAVLRLGAGSDAADSAELWASVGPAAPLGAPAPDLTGPLAGMLGNLLAFEVFRLTTEALPAETRHQIVVQDLDSLDVLTEPLLPHPRCPYCADGGTGLADEAGGSEDSGGIENTGAPEGFGGAETSAANDTSAANETSGRPGNSDGPGNSRAIKGIASVEGVGGAVVGQAAAPAAGTSAAEPAALPGEMLRTPHPDDEPVAPPADGAADEDAAKTLLAALEQRSVLVHERAGVFTAFADEDWEQTPLKVSTVLLGIVPGRTRRISAADVHTVAGARLTALFRAAEVYAEHVVPPRVLDAHALRAATGKWTRVAPAELTVSSGLDVPADRVAHWSEALSLTDGRTVLVPAGAVRTLSGWNALGLFERTSAGTGACRQPAGRAHPRPGHRARPRRAARRRAPRRRVVGGGPLLPCRCRRSRGALPAALGGESRRHRGDPRPHRRRRRSAARRPGPPHRSEDRRGALGDRQRPAAPRRRTGGTARPARRGATARRRRRTRHR